MKESMLQPEKHREKKPEKTSQSKSMLGFSKSHTLRFIFEFRIFLHSNGIIQE
jgi:hypothetical protein